MAKPLYFIDQTDCSLVDKTLFQFHVLLAALILKQRFTKRKQAQTKAIKKA